MEPARTGSSLSILTKAQEGEQEIEAVRVHAKPLLYHSAAAK